MCPASKAKTLGSMLLQLESWSPPQFRDASHAYLRGLPARIPQSHAKPAREDDLECAEPS